MTSEDRIMDAALRCVARWGIAKTTLDDIAREARCGRATVYRCFPGGKDVLLGATWDRELARFFDELAADVAGCDTLEDAIVRTIASASAEIAGHEAIQYLCEHEPASILPFVAFDGLGPLLDWSAAFAVPCLARFVPEEVARPLGAWVARLVVSYAFEPSPTAPDLTDPAVARRFTRTYILPGVDALLARDTLAPHRGLITSPSVPSTST